MRVAIIPARGGSRRIPRKNIRPFHGKPIIAYSIEAALKADFDRVIVSTDDDEIADVAESFGASVLRRPAEMARDEIGTQEVMKHAVKSLELQFSDALCCLYATCPMVDETDLHTAAWIQVCRPATFVVAVGTNPLRDAGAFYFGTAYDFMMHPLYGIRTAIFPIEEWRCIDINTEEDFRRAEAMYAALHREAA